MPGGGIFKILSNFVELPKLNCQIFLKSGFPGSWDGFQIKLYVIYPPRVGDYTLVRGKRVFIRVLPLTMLCIVCLGV